MHPDGRRLIFLGDLVDRGPDSPSVVRLVMECVKAGTALCVPGNHDMKFVRAIRGKNVQLTHGLAESLEQFRAYEQTVPGFAGLAAEFFDDLVSHYVLDDGKLVVARTRDGGKSFAPATQLNSLDSGVTECPQDAPAAAAAPDGKLLAAAWMAGSLRCGM